MQQELNSAAANLNDASGHVVASVRNPVQLADSSRHFGDAYKDLLGIGMEMAGQSKVSLILFNYLFYLIK